LLGRGRRDVVDDDPLRIEDQQIRSKDAQVDPERQEPLGLLLGPILLFRRLVTRMGMLDHRRNSVSRLLATGDVLRVEWLYFVFLAHASAE